MQPRFPVHFVVPLTLAGALLAEPALPAAPLYTEPWRPQFHFTPERNWMNDPNGMVVYDGEYHLFYQYNPFGDRWGHMSWGHAVSRDLVRWEHLPLALAEENGVMIFSGSAVVDWRNTSGFGTATQPPLVAIYTGHHTSRPLQDQQIAYSTDRGRTWTRYAGNPVLDLGLADFRDPKVFWHEPTARWIMVVALPVDRKVSFYASPNLKQWTHLSDFGPAGSVAGIWECPDLFPLPVENSRARDRSRHVLIVNVGSGAPAGGSGCQYFVGTFDGTRFLLDPDSLPPHQPAVAPEGRLLADFEGPDYGAWTATGDAFGPGPARGAFPGQQPVSGFRGGGLVNTFRGGDGPQGTLTSPEFEIDRAYLNFLIGGGPHPGRTCLNLRVDGEVVRTATGDAAERLDWKSWNVRDLRGRRAVLEIVDRESGGWGHLNVDHIVLADAPARPAVTPALWADWGSDFYAAVSWSDVPASDGRRLWLGWMSNWEYAQDVPTSPWRSAMTVPRVMALRRTPEGPRLIQQPVRELESLRQPGHRLGRATIADANAWLARQPELGELLDITLEWRGLGPGDTCAVRILGAAGEEIAVVHDAAEGRLRLDRTRSGQVDFHPRFPGVAEAPLRSRNGRLELRLLLDTSSIEVFAHDGEVVFSSLMFPTAAARRIELTAQGDRVRVRRLEIHPLQSIWPQSGQGIR